MSKYWQILTAFIIIALGANDLANATPAESTHPLQVGFSKIDFTPQPGKGTFGYGPDGPIAQGYRSRLYIRSLYLRTPQEQALMVSLDLGAVSNWLHINASKVIHEFTGLQPHQIWLSATHSHSAPGNIFDSWLLNRFGGPRSGFDKTFATEFIELIAESARLAILKAKPASAKLVEIPLKGHTLNRSLPAFENNRNREQDAVDTTWRSIVFENKSNGRLIGALHTFSIHGTANPAAFDLYDGDIHGALQSQLEKLYPDTTHLLMNATSGDVSPSWSPATRCEGCLDKSRTKLIEHSKEMAHQVRQGIDSHPSISLAPQNFRIQGAYFPLDPTSDENLCSPRVGSSALGGAEDFRSRWFGLKILGIEEGGRAIDQNRFDCQAPKRVPFPWIQRSVVPQNVAQYAFIGHLELGDLTILSLPLEITTQAGRDVLASINEQSEGDKKWWIVSLVNGYHHYLTTTDEFMLQHYEGGSNVFGPLTIRFFKNKIKQLISQIPPQTPEVLTPRHRSTRAFPLHQSKIPTSKANRWASAFLKNQLTPSIGSLTKECFIPPVQFTWRGPTIRPWAASNESLVTIRDISDAIVDTDLVLNIELRKSQELDFSRSIWEITWHPSPQIQSGEFKVSVHYLGENEHHSFRICDE